MPANPPTESHWEITVDEHQLETVGRCSDELSHLKRGQVFLPSEIFLIARSHRRHKIVEIHYDVHHRVEKGKERRVSSANEKNARP